MQWIALRQWIFTAAMQRLFSLSLLGRNTVPFWGWGVGSKTGQGKMIVRWWNLLIFKNAQDTHHSYKGWKAAVFSLQMHSAYPRGCNRHMCRGTWSTKFHGCCCQLIEKFSTVWAWPTKSTCICSWKKKRPGKRTAVAISSKQSSVQQTCRNHQWQSWGQRIPECAQQTEEGNRYIRHAGNGKFTAVAEP